MKNKIMQNLLIALLILFTGTVSMLAQSETTAVVLGTVNDSKGAVIPDAKVELFDQTINKTLTTMTSSDGYFVFPRVFPGIYKVIVTKGGFQQLTVPDLKTEVTKSYTLNLQLEVGSITENIEVKASELGAQLQRSDSSVGATITSEQMLRLPNINRSAATLFSLQPLITPSRGGALFQGGQVSGNRSDQSSFILDGIDATDFATGNNFYTSAAIDFNGPGPVVPVPAESIEEFRVTTTNASAATFGRSSGGQTAFVTKRGTNSFNGTAYLYFQNDKFNANSWDFNRNGIRKQPLRDNRYGVSFGGPILKDKAFFFFHYEGRRFSRSVGVSRLVPTQTLRQGILRFRDASGQIVSYDARQFDPRNIGISPTIRSFWNLLPEGNDVTVAGADGLNTTGFFAPVKLPNNLDFGVVRFDYLLNDKWQIYGTYRQSSQFNQDSTQLDIAGLTSGNSRGVATSVASTPVKPLLANVKITGQLLPTLFNEIVIGYTRNFWAFERAKPFPQVSGINGALLAAQSFLDQGVDVDTQRARSRVWRDNSWQFGDNLNLQYRQHTLQFGGIWRYNSIFHQRDDKVVGSLTSLVYEINSGSTSIPTTSRPPVCQSGVTSNCLISADVGRYNDLFAATLGIVNRVGILTARDTNLNLLPLGTPLQINGSIQSYDFYVNDNWKIRPNLSANFGLTYSLETPPTDRDGKQTILTNQATNKPLIVSEYLNARYDAAINGQVYNPTLSYVPIRESGRESIYDLDWNNFSPRVSVAWTPSLKSGILKAILGEDKTVLRSGYSLNYDRINASEIIMIPVLGVGFSQTVNCTGPTVSGICNGTTNISNAFRIGVDGTNIPLPVSQTLSSPIIPTEGRSPGETLSFSIDPRIKNGFAHNVNLTLQRELPGGMILEIGYVGNFGRKLIQNVQLNSIPFFMKDAASGQTFAQAFDAVAAQLRAGVLPSAVVAQPWFENQLRSSSLCGTGTCTAAIAANQSTNFIQGAVNSIFTVINNERPAGPIINRQSTSFFVKTNGGISNYNAAFISLNKRLSKGLLFSINYTLSKSRDQYGLNQVSTGVNSVSYNFGIDYGPSLFDRKHIFNANWYYDLPFSNFSNNKKGALNKLIGGWYLSGIFTASSGLPLTVGQHPQAFGGDPLNFAITAGAIPLNQINYGSGVNTGITGSGNVAVNGNPGNSGSGLNLFLNPQDAYNNFRYILLSQDTRHGRGVLRGLPRWNLDISIGKRTAITEKIKTVFTFDALNVLNRVEFEDPDLDLRRPANFGVITRQFGSPRIIQFGLRLEF